MNRKNTILLAVLINAGLLVVLFVTALTTQEEVSIPPTHEMAAAPKNTPDAAPLFGDEIDLAMRQAPTADVLPQVVPDPSANAKPAEQTLVHQLPPLVPEAASAAAPIEVPVAASPVKSDAPFAQVTVKKGDTLEKIAKANKTTVDEIIKLNHLSSSFLRIGQTLKIPAAKSAVAKAVKAAAPEKRAVESGPDYYTVKVGDNPWTIAMKHHLKVEELLKLNGLNEEKARKLKPGDRLRIR